MTDQPTELSVRALLEDWVSAESYRISESSGNMTKDWRSLVSLAMARATALGVEWDDGIVPEYIRDSLRYADEEDQP